MSNFDRGDFAARYRGRSDGGGRTSIAWPIAPAEIRRTGDTVTEDRDGHGRKHRGIDVFAAAGTEVLAALGGRVVRVEDGRISTSEGRRRAGLWIDIRGTDGRIYRYLHLGTAIPEEGEAVRQGQVIGTVAAPFTSGLRKVTHLHFEVRVSDYSSATREYGAAINPLSVLPPLAA